MRLTADLITGAPTYFNTLKEREILLRGNKIAIIENLGATQDQFDSIDFSDNEILKLDGFPLLNRLRSILLNNNLITKISSSIVDQLPNLESLVLTNNRIANLVDIDPLAGCKKLRRLSLLDNPISKKQHYRLYVIHRLPQIRILDFRKVKQKERIASEKLFGTQAKPKQSAIAQAVRLSESTVVSNEPKQTSNGQSAHSQSERDAIKTAIQNATSIEEVARLEKALASGQIPDKMES